MAEVAGATAQREDKVIELQRALLQEHLPAREIQVPHLIHQDGDLGPSSENGTNRLRNIRRGKAGGRDLVKQGLKQMMVGAVNQSHLCAGMVEMLAKRQAAKACAQDNNMWSRILRHAVLCIQMGRNAIQPAVMRPKGTCRYKGCTTVVQGMYNGCTRDVQGINTLAIPEQSRSNTGATRSQRASPSPGPGGRRSEEHT